VEVRERISPVQKKPTKAAKQTRNWKNVTVRIYADEYQLLVALCDALSTPGSRVDKSLLMRTAAVAEATLLGFSPAVPQGDPSVPRRPRKWKYEVPEREDESYSEQLTITVHPLELTAVEHAAEWAGVKLQRFFMGSLLRFGAKRKQADPENPKLRPIQIPARFGK
jgi:hypothetical protein